MITISEEMNVPKIEGFISQKTERDDVIREMADYLVSKGAVKPKYGQAVIDRENIYPTGIPTEPIGVAIPHSERDFVLDTTILVAKLPKPVIFHRIDETEEKMEVSVVFMLAVDSNQGQLDVIANLMGLVQDQDLVKEITLCEDSLKIGEIVSRAYPSK